MRVSPEKPFKLVYSLFSHEYLGVLMESFVVQLDENGSYSLAYQNISAKNAPDFAAGLDEDDYELIKSYERNLLLLRCTSFSASFPVMQKQPPHLHRYPAIFLFHAMLSALTTMAIFH